MSPKEEAHKLHICFFPFMAQGHMIPTLDMAKLFSSRDAKSTLITTSLNSEFFVKSIETFKNMKPCLEIGITTLDFAFSDLGLPEGCENVDSIFSKFGEEAGEVVLKFMMSTMFLRQKLEELIEAIRPDCLVADMLFPWATEASAKFDVPRVVFHGTCCFSLCAGSCVALQKPYETVASSFESFVIPHLPGDIVMSAEQITGLDKDTEPGKFVKVMRDSEKTSFGVLVNSFYELEPAYVDFFRDVLGRRSWQLGPVFRYATTRSKRKSRGAERRTSTGQDSCCFRELQQLSCCYHELSSSSPLQKTCAN